MSANDSCLSLGDLEIMELRSGLARSRHNEQTLALQLENARTTSQYLLNQLLDVSEREKALRANIHSIEARVLTAEMDAQLSQKELAHEVEKSTHLIELLERGSRIVEEMDKTHSFELGLVETGVRVAAVVKERQPRSEDEKAWFVAQSQAFVGVNERKVILAYDPNAPPAQRQGPTSSRSPDLLLPNQKADGTANTRISPSPPMAWPPTMPLRQISRGMDIGHARKPTDYDGVLRHILGPEAATQFICPR